MRNKLVIVILVFCMTCTGALSGCALNDAASLVQDTIDTLVGNNGEAYSVNTGEAYIVYARGDSGYAPTLVVDFEIENHDKVYHSNNATNYYIQAVQGGVNLEQGSWLSDNPLCLNWSRGEIVKPGEAGPCQVVFELQNTDELVNVIFEAPLMHDLQETVVVCEEAYDIRALETITVDSDLEVEVVEWDISQKDGDDIIAIDFRLSNQGNEAVQYGDYRVYAIQGMTELDRHYGFRDTESDCVVSAGAEKVIQVSFKLDNTTTPLCFLFTGDASNYNNSLHVFKAEDIDIRK